MNELIRLEGMVNDFARALEVFMESTSERMAGGMAYDILHSMDEARDELRSVVDEMEMDN